jgi:hypothetical protein
MATARRRPRRRCEPVGRQRIEQAGPDLPVAIVGVRQDETWALRLEVKPPATTSDVLPDEENWAALRKALAPMPWIISHHEGRA